MGGVDGHKREVVDKGGQFRNQMKIWAPLKITRGKFPSRTSTDRCLSPFGQVHMWRGGFESTEEFLFGGGAGEGCVENG